MRRSDRLATVLVVLASILAIVALISTWVREQALDTGQWTDTSSQIIESPAVQQATATLFADLVSEPRAGGRIEELLPPRLAPLAGPIRGAAADVVERATLRGLRNGRFQRFWERSNRLAHGQLVAAIERGSDRAVVLDLRPMLGRVAERTGFGITPGQQERAVVRVLEEDQLGSVRKGARILRGTAWWSTTLALLLLAAAVALAADRRRILARAGGGLIAAALVLLLARRVGIAEGTPALAKNPDSEDAVRDTLTIATTLLGDFGRMVLALGAALLFAAWLTGPGRAATAIGARMRPAIARAPVVAHGMMAAIVIFVLLNGLLPWSARPLAILAYLAGGALLVESIRRAADVEPEPAK